MVLSKILCCHVSTINIFPIFTCPSWVGLSTHRIWNIHGVNVSHSLQNLVPLVSFQEELIANTAVMKGLGIYRIFNALVDISANDSSVNFGLNIISFEFYLNDLILINVLLICTYLKWVFHHVKAYYTFDGDISGFYSMNGEIGKKMLFSI